MFQPLYLFLINHKKLAIPGLGTIILSKEPASGDIVNRVFLPPSFIFSFEPGRDDPSKQLFSWLSSVLQVSEREAIIQYNDFAFDLKKQLDKGHEINWDRVGHFKKVLGGELRFQPYHPELDFLTPVRANKVMHQNPQHTMRVGEQEMTTTEITHILSAEPLPKKTPWWAWPVALAVVLVILLGWFLSENRQGNYASGNLRTISPSESPASYRVLR
jgi:hypothetical protein